VRYGLRPLALVLSSCVGTSNTDSDELDDDQLTAWTAKAGEAAQLLISLVKNGSHTPLCSGVDELHDLIAVPCRTADEDFEDYIKRIRQAAHKEGLPALLLSLLSRCHEVLLSSASAPKKTKQQQRKDAARQKQARQLATTICTALTWSLKDEGSTVFVCM
jgi:hypothetical protein